MTSSIPSQIFPGEVFTQAVDFDTGIRQLLPKYDEMLEAIVGCLPASGGRILELGCGTAELSLKILRRFPSVEIIAIDYSPRMLEVARKKIESSGFSQRWTGLEMDFGDWANETQSLPFNEGFHACVSSLAIHHLSDAMKLKLFQRISQSLEAGGCFWNADPILPESERMRTIYQTVREDWAIQQGTTLAEIRAKVGSSTPFGHSQPDQLASLSTHLEMLKLAGFTTIAVPWKYYGIAVFGGWVEEVKDL